MPRAEVGRGYSAIRRTNRQRVVAVAANIDRTVVTGNQVLEQLQASALLAIPLRSYTQPLLIMSTIPFGLVGAVWGHVVMGINLSFMSVEGMIALTGVVVNASLVLVHSINTLRDQGVSLTQAVVDAALQQVWNDTAERRAVVFCRGRTQGGCS